MLPIPTKDYIPIFYNRDEELTIFANKLDSYLIAWGDETLDMDTFYDPVRCPQAFVVELGNLVAANIQNTDSDRAKREKVAASISSLKRRATWKFDVKLTVDAFVGGDSQLVDGSLLIDDDAIVWGGVGEPDEPEESHWSTFGTNGGTNPYLGMAVFGGAEPDGSASAGIVFIDVDDNSLTEAQLEDLKDQLEDVIAAYYRVVLGYDDGAGFQPYPTGEIG
jgi:hypothetical protein